MDGPETFMGLWIWNLVSPNRADVLNIKAEIKKMLEPTSQPFYQLFLVLPEADFLRVSQIVVDRQTQCFHALKALRKIHDPPYKIRQTPQILKYMRAHCRVLIFLYHFCKISWKVIFFWEREARKPEASSNVAYVKNEIFVCSRQKMAISFAIPLGALVTVVLNASL